jgi:hypothetical protein
LRKESSQCKGCNYKNPVWCRGPQFANPYPVCYSSHCVTLQLLLIKLLKWNIHRRQPRLGRSELSWNISRRTKISARCNGSGRKRKRKRRKKKKKKKKKK